SRSALTAAFGKPADSTAGPADPDGWAGDGLPEGRKRSAPPACGEAWRCRARRGNRPRLTCRYPDHQHPHGQETADALVTLRRPPAAPTTHPRPQRRPRRRLQPLVPRVHPDTDTRCLTPRPTGTPPPRRP